jgi:hypothetical protein
VVELAELWRRLRSGERAANHRDHALAKARGFFDLPDTDVGIGRRWRQHENDRVGLADEVGKTLSPLLSAGDRLPVQRCLEAEKPKRDIELIGKVEIVPAVGNEDLELAAFTALEALDGHHPN